MTSRSVFAAMLLVASLLAPVGTRGQTLPAQVRVPERQDYTNAHMGPSSGQPVLVLVPAGTVLPVIRTQGEWYLVRLAPELRKLGIRMRWYKNEDQGWVHESTVEPTAGSPQPPQEPSLDEGAGAIAGASPSAHG